MRKLATLTMIIMVMLGATACDMLGDGGGESNPAAMSLSPEDKATLQKLQNKQL